MSDATQSLRTPALIGLAVFAFASGGLGLLAEAPFLFFLDFAWAHLATAAGLAALGFVALKRADPRLLAATGVLGVVLFASAANGLPSPTGWALAIAGGVGFLAFVENAVL